MFFFLVPVVREKCPEVGVFARVDPLVVLVDRFQLLHEGGNRAMHVSGLIG